MAALTPAERQRIRRARQKAGQQAPTCEACGCALVPGVGGSEARLLAQLCRACWLQTPEGSAAEADRRRAEELTDKARARKAAWAAEARRKAREAKQQGEQE